MKHELVIKQAATMPLITVKRGILLLLSTCLLFVCSFTVSSQTVVSNETFPNQFNINFPSNNQSNGTFTGATGTWTASANSRAALAVIQAYYSPSTYAIKLVNFNTSGVGSGDCHAASPTVNLSSYSCSPNLNLSFKLYSYTCSSSDPNSTFNVEFSTDNGSTWTSVWSMSSAAIFNAYGNNGLTTVTVAIPAAYRVSGFKYRFSGYKPANESHNFYLFVDDAKINATACCDPNDPTAGNGTSFCAPAPNCLAGNFLWSQSINQSNGDPSVVRLYDGGTTSYLIPVNTYPALLTAGNAVTINISDVVSYDGYTTRNTVTQANERWRLQFRKNGNVVYTTSFTNDLTDNVKQAYWRGSLGTADLPNGADQIYIQHWSVVNSGQGANSVVPVSVCMSVTVTPPVTNPDFNSTFVNVPVPGNVNTNDRVPVGTTYGTTPTLLSSPAGSSPSITMNANGTYSFVSNKPGVYTYDVPVCVPGQVAPCPKTKLVITVLDKNVNTNPPVANVDIAITNINTPVTLKTLANDAAGNPANSLVTSSVTVTGAPLHGTTSVNPATGDITYTPSTGYTGTDTLTYNVCDDQSPAKCATAKQIITIKPAGSPNTTEAADDYRITDINTPASGNVKTNDNDPEGNTQTVTAQNTTVSGKGTLVLATDGSYTFTPVTGYTGPVDFPYTTCDNGTPQACAMATLHILVRPIVPVTNPDFNSTFVNVPVPGNVSTNDKVPSGTTYGTSPTLLSSPAGSSPSLTMNPDGTYSFVSNVKGVYIYDVPVCVPGQTAPCPPTKLTITVLDGTTNSNAPVANVDIATTKVNTPVTLKSLINDAAGNTTSALVPSSVTVTVAPLHGTTSVNPATGDITYTPAAGYIGTDTLTYQVCDDQSPAKCATANQIITIKPTVSPNTTEAADDYKITPINTPATGNVKTNDSDAEGNTQTVTAQNTTIAGKGNLVLGTDGNYTFTPVTGFTGPVDFPYTTCDNGTPQACAAATLHILVKPVLQVPDLTPSIFNDGTTLIQNTTRDNVIRIFNIGTGATSGTIIFTVPKMMPAYEITVNATETFMDVFGGLPVANNDWTIVEEATRYVFTSKPGVVIAGGGGSKDIGVKVKAIGIKSSTANLSVRIVFGTGGGETPFNNNADNNTYSTN